MATEYELHELGTLFPPMPDDEFAALKADIAANGLLTPIALLGGKVLDGRHRLRACQELGMFPPRIEHLPADTDGLTYVLSANLHRRHLTAGQRAAFTAELPRQKGAGRSIENSDNNYSDKLCHDGTIYSDTERAELSGVGIRTQKRADAVHDASPDLHEAVKAGDVPLAVAYDEVQAANRGAAIEEAPAPETEPLAKPGGWGAIPWTPQSVPAESPADAPESESEATRPHLSRGTGEEAWFTPPSILDASRAVMGNIDLDPASCAAAQEVVRANRFFGEYEDGLAQEWQAAALFINPPFTRGKVEAFAEKLLSGIRAGNVQSAIWLSNNSTETGWCQSLLKECQAAFFPSGRVKYWRPGKDGRPAYSSGLCGDVLMYFGSNPDLFIAEFRDRVGGVGFHQ